MSRPAGNWVLIVIIAGVLAGLALLCKQTFVAALVAGALWRWPKIPIS